MKWDMKEIDGVALLLQASPNSIWAHLILAILKWVIRVSAINDFFISVE